MKRRPPIATRTDPPLPYPTQFRSRRRMEILVRTKADAAADRGSTRSDAGRLSDAARRSCGATKIALNFSRSGSRASSRHDAPRPAAPRSEEHTPELQSLMRISYAVFCLKKKNKLPTRRHHNR